MQRASLSLCEKLRQCRTYQGDSQLHFFLRCSYCLVFYILLVIAKTYGLLNHSTPECIRDDFFTLSQSMNNYLATHPTVLKALIGTSSLTMDFLFLSTIFLFVFYYRSWRACICALMTYSTRAIVLLIFGLRMTQNYLWKYPGFPSLFPYSLGDFFFSGHISLLLIASLELYNYKLYWLSMISVIFLVFNAIVLVATHSHYSMDIVAGLVFTHYFYLTAGQICERLESKGVHQRKIPLGDSQERPRQEQEAPLISLPGNSGQQPLFVEQRAT